MSLLRILAVASFIFKARIACAHQLKQNPGCGRGRDCGYLAGGETPPSLSIPCADGVKHMSPNSVFVRGRGGKNAIYCAVPKVGTSYSFGVMADLNLPVKDGKRNSGYETVKDIFKENYTGAIDDLCNAWSFIIIRNPWERLVSGYVDKVLTGELFKEIPSFDKFMRGLASVKRREMIAGHFRPVSYVCHTTGIKGNGKMTRQRYDEKIEIEDDLRAHLQQIFINKLGLEENEVVSVLDRFDGLTHSTQFGARWRELDKSINSGMSRVDFYFQQSDPHLVEEIFEDDIIFGNYTYEGHQPMLHEDGERALADLEDRASETAQRQPSLRERYHHKHQEHINRLSRAEEHVD